MARTVAKLDLEIQDNATWQDAFQLGTDGDTSWDLVGEHFVMDVKGARDEPDPLMTLSTDNGRIVIDDTTLRVIHFNVVDVDIQADIPASEEYVYDLVMYNNASPPRRVALMGGKVRVCKGVTEE